MIANCTDCDIYLCDYTATVSVDKCSNCRLFIGPCESSVFIRNLENCDVVVACQQFRTRDCKNVNTLLFCSTEPVVEESSNMRSGCFQFAYFSLRGQFASANLSVFANRWSELYDFAPKEGNIVLMSPEEESSVAVRPLSEVCGWVSTEEEDQMKDTVVPITHGKRTRPEGEEAFVIAVGGGTDSAVEFWKAVRQEQTLVQTVEVTLDKSKAKLLFQDVDA